MEEDNGFNPPHYVSNLPEEQHLDEHSYPKRLEVFNRIYNNLKPLVDAQKSDVHIGVHPEAGADFEKLVELMGNQIALDYTAAQSGDIVWWKTDNEAISYLLAEKTHEHSLYGSLRYVEKDGEIKDYPSIFIQGSTLGGSLKLGSIVEGLFVEMVVPSPTPLTAEDFDKPGLTEQEFWERRPRTMHSARVTGMGLIRSSTLSEAQESS